MQFACQHWTVIVCERKTVLRLRLSNHEDATMSLRVALLYNSTLPSHTVWTFFFFKNWLGYIASNCRKRLPQLKRHKSTCPNCFSKLWVKQWNFGQLHKLVGKQWNLSKFGGSRGKRMALSALCLRSTNGLSSSSSSSSSMSSAFLTWHQILMLLCIELAGQLKSHLVKAE